MPRSRNRKANAPAPYLAGLGQTALDAPVITRNCLDFRRESIPRIQAILEAREGRVRKLDLLAQLRREVRADRKRMKAIRQDAERARARKAGIPDAPADLPIDPDPTRLITGVSYRPTGARPWHAVIAIGHGRFQVNHPLGSFGTRFEAALAYDRAALHHRGPNARLNYPELFPASQSPTHPRYIGVNREGSGRYRVLVYTTGHKRINCGMFDSPLEAARAYDRAALRIKGPGARLNFPHEQLAEDQHAIDPGPDAYLDDRMVLAADAEHADARDHQAAHST